MQGYKKLYNGRDRLRTLRIVVFVCSAVVSYPAAIINVEPGTADDSAIMADHTGETIVYGNMGTCPGNAVTVSIGTDGCELNGTITVAEASAGSLVLLIGLFGLLFLRKLAARV